MRVLVKMVHGSHLYGLNTENSDMDFKGIFLPSLEGIVQLNPQHEIRHSTGGSNSKNTSEDVDTDFYSVQKFLKMACDGETIALDMLHCDAPAESSSIWESIRANRNKFYTKNMKAFLGYCNKQAAKYGIRGSRLDAIGKVIEYLKIKQYSEELFGTDLRMDSSPFITMGLKELSVEYPEYIEVKEGFQKGDKWIDKRVLQVCESKYDFTCKIHYVIEQLQKKYDAYGERAKQAKNNEGIDWKAVSHAMRAGLQLKEIYETGDLKYPLKDADYLLKIKKGELDYTTEVAPALEDLIDEVERLADASDYPETVDRKFWEGFIAGLYLRGANS